MWLTVRMDPLMATPLRCYECSNSGSTIAKDPYPMPKSRFFAKGQGQSSRLVIKAFDDAPMELAQNLDGLGLCGEALAPVSMTIGAKGHAATTTWRLIPPKIPATRDPNGIDSELNGQGSYIQYLREEIRYSSNNSR